MTSSRRGAAALAILALLPLGCESSPPPSRRATSEPGARISPLGIDQPDPERLFRRALEASERGDADAFLACFAFQSPSGLYFIPQGGEANLEADAARMRSMAAGLRHLMNSDWTTVRYGRSRNVRNDPPTVEVEMEVNYDFDRASPADRERALRDVNAILAAQGARAPMTWDQYTRQLAALPRTSARRFVFLGGDWRFDAAWKVSPDGWRPTEGR
ncbi:MAG: hypothetical protein R3F20_00595 [Planctomycetota bacterium]